MAHMCAVEETGAGSWRVPLAGARRDAVLVNGLLYSLALASSVDGSMGILEDLHRPVSMF